LVLYLGNRSIMEYKDNGNSDLKNGFIALCIFGLIVLGINSCCSLTKKGVEKAVVAEKNHEEKVAEYKSSREYKDKLAREERYWALSDEEREAMDEADGLWKEGDFTFARDGETSFIESCCWVIFWLFFTSAAFALMPELAIQELFGHKDRK